VRRISKHNINTCWWIGALLCVSLTACTSDSTIQEEDVDDGSVPMQFSQAVMSAPVRRAASTTNYLTQGFLVSCWKGFGSAKKSVVMDKYEVKYKTDPWANLSKWDYVGSTAEGYRKTQIERYWDANAFPYRFYAISPCPAADSIDKYFKLTDTELVIPTTYVYQTCNNGVLTAGAEPYMPAQVECPDGSNVKDIDLLNNTVISKDRTQNGATTSYERYVALPFHHLTSKVRFAIYSSNGATFKLSNIKIKAQRTDGFITSANGYTADLTTTDMLSGQFTKTTAENTGCMLLIDEGFDNAASFDKSEPYWFQCKDGMLQIPQQDVKLSISFDINNTPHSDIPIAVKNGENTIDSFTWESNKIYTYLINISDINPLAIEFSAELAPWIEVYGSIETNLEQ
jgi:hypothetical protein